MARSIAFIAVCEVLMLAANVFAVPITQPTSLNFGDQYRLAFRTSSATVLGTSTNIADYNTFVTNAANAVTELANLGTTWTAIASTPTVDARDNTNTVPSTVTGGSLGVPIFTLDDLKVVDSNDDLWDGTLDGPIKADEFGNITAVVNPWTGTTTAGIGQLGNELGQTIAQDGSSDQTGAAWIENALVTTGGSHNKTLYAISGILTVVPEPSTFLLAILGLLGVAGLRSAAARGIQA